MPAIEITDSKGLIQVTGTGVTSTSAVTLSGGTTLTGATTITGLTSTGFGAGLAGTGTAPTQTIVQIGEEIITTTKIDLTGLQKQSDIGDVIGKVGGGAAYIAVYNPATHGVLTKIEISCVELPTGTNVLLDFDLISANTSILAVAGDAAGASNAVSLTAMAGNIALGQTYQDLTAGTPNASGNAIYLCEGATSSDQQVYTAGMLIVKLYGHKTF